MTYLQNLALWAKGWTRLREIPYKPGWTAWGWKPFWIVYGTTYLAGTLAGYGVVSLSRAWYDRREQSQFARFMTRLLDWALPGSAHGRHTGPRLWGSKNLRD